MKSAAGIVIAFILTVLFGRLIPIVLLALILIFPVVVFKTAVKEGKSL